MNDAVEALILDLLGWVGAKRRKKLCRKDGSMAQIMAPNSRFGRMRGITGTENVDGRLTDHVQSAVQVLIKWRIP